MSSVSLRLFCSALFHATIEFGIAAAVTTLKKFPTQRAAEPSPCASARMPSAAPCSMVWFMAKRPAAAVAARLSAMFFGSE